ncbi:hypothetical protein E5Q_04471, partial [Mixia osmundae IAM 14324]
STSKQRLDEPVLDSLRRLLQQAGIEPADVHEDEHPWTRFSSRKSSKGKDRAQDESIRQRSPEMAWLAAQLLERNDMDRAVALLASAANDESIQEQLLDIVGYDRIESLPAIIARRPAIAEEVKLRDQAALLAHSEPSDSPHQPSSYNQPRTRQLQPQIDVKTADERAAIKQARKAGQKGKKNTANGAASSQLASGRFDAAELQRIREQQLLEASQRPLWTSEARPDTALKLPNVYASSASHGGTTLSFFGQKYTLPVGTTRQAHEHYDEVSIPVARQLPMRKDERLIHIDELDPIAKGSFPGYATLNRLQSVVYPIAYQTNESMLVSAPTGAGKTDVAMLTMLRAISQYGDLDETADNRFVMRNNDFKIIYVAPMKALAAEVVRKMSKRMAWLGVKVRELTGDMQLTRSEIVETHVIVTTPEKWDVVTRKTTGEGQLSSKVRLLIIDEVHLLHDDRGAVIESIVARTLRQVESSQSLIRIVGLSATLPNYIDVASFLRVNLYRGLFYFDGSFRPVPLEQHFLGVKGKAGSPDSRTNLDKACFDKVAALVKEGHQVMVFVHARKDTVKTAEMLREQASSEGLADLFDAADLPRYDGFKREVGASRNRELKELFSHGFGIHHAGMLRSDRTLSERLFESNMTKVLCCTATLAWGVNLPAYAVVIKGTQVYDAGKGSFVDLGILDVLQIFGRAGRPQYETHGVGYICTTADKLDHYVSAITQQHPIESRFVTGLVDSLNAEIALGTVTSIDEGVRWISYTYLFVRIRQNPMAYGISPDELVDDPSLGSKRHLLITQAAIALAKAQMISFDADSGSLRPTEVGSIASRYYIRFKSMEIFNERMRPSMSNADALALLCMSTEFEQIAVRDTETVELSKLISDVIPCEVIGGTKTTPGKVNVLLQSYISRATLVDFALISDQGYVAQNAGRIARAVFEIALSRGHAALATVMLDLSKSIEKRMWAFDHPLGQTDLPRNVQYNIRQYLDDYTVEDIANATEHDLGEALRLNDRLGGIVKLAAQQFPRVMSDTRAQPIAPDLLRLTVTVTPQFEWTKATRTSVQPFYLWITDATDSVILDATRLVFKSTTRSLVHRAVLTHEPMTEALHVHLVSERWLGSDVFEDVELVDVHVPALPDDSTVILDVPLFEHPRTIAADPFKLSGKTHDAVETQIFHSIMHTSANVLVACATAHNRLTVRELALTRHLRLGDKILLVSASPAGARLAHAKLTSAVTPLGHTLGLLCADRQREDIPDILITDASSLIRRCEAIGTAGLPDVALCICEELQSLNTEYELALAMLSSHRRKTRYIGLACSLQTSGDLAQTLEVPAGHIYSFAPSVRMTSLTTDFRPFYQSTSASLLTMMLRPAYEILRKAAGTILCVVPSEDQCRQTLRELSKMIALDLDAPDAFIGDHETIDIYAGQLGSGDADEALQRGLVAMHARMSPKARRIASSLSKSGAARVLIATSDAAVAHKISFDHVLILGTEFGVYSKDGERQHCEYSPADLVALQDLAIPSTSGGTATCLVMSSPAQIALCSRSLLSGLSLESDLEVNSLASFILRFVAVDVFNFKQKIIDLLSGSYLNRRLVSNPDYYSQLPGEELSLTQLVDEAIALLQKSGAIRVESGSQLCITRIGQAALQSHIAVETLGDRIAELNEHSLKAITGANETSLRHYYSKLPRRVQTELGKADILDLTAVAVQQAVLLAGLKAGRVPSDAQLEQLQYELVSGLFA